MKLKKKWLANREGFNNSHFSGQFYYLQFLEKNLSKKFFWLQRSFSSRTSVLVRAQDCHNWNADKNNFKSEMSFQKEEGEFRNSNSPKQKLIKNQTGKNPHLGALLSLIFFVDSNQQSGAKESETRWHNSLISWTGTSSLLKISRQSFILTFYSYRKRLFLVCHQLCQIYLAKWRLETDIKEFSHPDHWI